MPQHTKEERRQYMAEWRAKNPESSREKDRAYRQGYYALNKERIQARLKKWRGSMGRTQARPPAYRMMVVSLLLERDGDVCWVCGQQMSFGTESIEHKTPKYAGGHETDPGNLALSHKTCNIRRPRPEKRTLGK